MGNLVSCETRIVSDIPVSDVPVESKKRLSVFDCVAGMFMAPVAASAHPTRYQLCRSGFILNPLQRGFGCIATDLWYVLKKAWEHGRCSLVAGLRCSCLP